MIKILNIRKLLMILVVSAAASACVSNITKEEWPSEIPDRSIFVNAWKKQSKAGTNDNSLDNHLLWVIRFYEGSVLYPIGWNDMSNSLLDSLNSQSERDAMRRRLQALGETICIEWAQNNADRKINSSAIAVWGNALRTSAERNEQDSFVSRVEADVIALLEGNLHYSQIVRERYYPPDDYDNF